MHEGGASHFEPIAISAESTVVAEYPAEASPHIGYQSEAELEREFIGILESQAYERLHVHSEQDLVANLRRQLETLNQITFSDAEWEQFFSTQVASANAGIADKTVNIQEDHVKLLRRDDGSTKNVRLIDKEHVHNNRLQVLNQYETGVGEGGGKHATRYDVTILVNGLPLVHVELKRRGVDIREAFNQIDRYQRDSFWAGTGLFEYVQLFVISNGTLTKYYSNTTRSQHIKEASGSKRTKKTSNSFEFTSWWADANNRPIQDLPAFAKTFFARHTLLNILTRYCVLTSDRLLLAMRPYQIVATEKILSKIQIATNYKQLGTLDAGGYVWHTTGSGKTLTSFKAAQLATRMPGVEKVLFVVDRKDLDYQTMREYDRFQKGAANSNTSTAVLKKQLEDPSARIIITTIQKLATFIAANRGHEIYTGHVVIIFDECHRSQFGDMHTAITRAFKRYHLFGFTGTPIFAANSGTGGNPQLKTTEQAFGDKLHTYTIVDAITDKNVLPFRIDYVNTIQVGQVADKQVSAIDTERALLAPERLAKIVGYTLEHFDQKTKRSQAYTLGEKRVRGFNALFATASIQAARMYYNQFALQQQGLTPDKRLKVGLIYSYAANEAVGDGVLDEEGFDTYQLEASARDFLEDAIQDYNDLFGTSFDTSSQKFENYYKDLSQRLKNREIDLVIVVNMFLTGFDATTLNTLFVDKNLRAHGLIQAYSRQPHPQLGQDLRQHRLLPRPRRADQRRDRPVRQPRRPRCRPPQALPRVLRRVRREGHRTPRPLPPRPTDHQRDRAEGVHRPLRRHPAADQHPHLVRRLHRPRDPHRPPEPGLPQPLPRLLRRVPQRRGCGEGGHQRRRGLRDRAGQAGRDQRRLHPHARRQVPPGTRRRRRQGAARHHHPRRRRLPVATQQKGPHRGLRRLRLRPRPTRRRMAGLHHRTPRSRTANHHRRRTPQARRDQTLHRPRLRRRHNSDHRHSRDEYPASRLPLRPRERPRREKGKGAVAAGRLPRPLPRPRELGVTQLTLRRPTPSAVAPRSGFEAHECAPTGNPAETTQPRRTGAEPPSQPYSRLMDNQQTTSTEHLDNFNGLVKNQRFVMFTTRSTEGKLVSRPMTIAERENDLFRFVTQDDNDVATQSDGQQVNLSIMDGSIYVSMSGTGRIARSVAKKQELWNRIQEAYAGDAEDPSNVILEVTVETAEYWDGVNQVAALLGLAKAAVTGERPNDGEHGTVQL